MNWASAKEFLERHQPLPDDAYLTDEQAGMFFEICEALEDDPREDFLPLLLGALGSGTGHGTFHTVNRVLDKLPRAVVVRELLNGMQSAFPSVREWCFELATRFADRSMWPVAIAVIKAPHDEPIEFWAAIILCELAGQPDLETLKTLRADLLYNESRELLDEGIARLQEKRSKNA